MASLDQLLSKTLLHAAAGGRRSSAVPSLARGDYWAFKTSAGALGSVTELRCRQPQHDGHGGHEVVYCGAPTPSGALVCQSIDWSDLTVGFALSPSPEVSVKLPLTSAHLLKSEYLSGGRSVAGGNSAWPLSHDFDIGMQHVFGFEWDSKASKIKPMDKSRVDANDFWLLFDGQQGQAVQTGATNRTNTYQVIPLRFLVCVSLVCCKPKADFTPGFDVKLLGADLGPNPVIAARFFPHLAVMTNKAYAFKHYDADVKLMRPSLSNHGALDPSMSSNIGASAYADSNFDRDAGVPSLLPLWQYIFDWYKPEAPVGQEFVAVYPSTAKARVFVGKDADGDKWSNEKRTYRGCTEQLENGLIDWDYSDDKKYYEKRAVRKMPGQGEFDNIHLAPTMRSADGVAKYPGWGFDKIVMAPFCVHDCMHMHWRWGSGLPMLEDWNKGWGPGGAYQSQGAPMVPAHQQVWITPMAEAGSPNAHGLRYRVRGNELQTETWDIALSHGAAYSYDVTVAGSLVSGAAAVSTMDLDPTWANLYWLLRYVRRGSGRDRRPLERLRFVDAAGETKVRKG
jgi:hypothetical protein